MATTGEEGKAGSRKGLKRAAHSTQSPARVLPPRVVSQSYEEVAVDAIGPHPENPNRGDVATIAESVEENGFFGACLVQASTRRIIAGEHRWRAAKATGLTSVPVLWADVSDAEALRMMLAENATGRNRQTDQTALAKILRSIGTHRGTGYNAEEQAALIASIRPTLGYLDALATGGAESDDEPGDGAEVPDEDLEREGPTRNAGAHALAIVLTTAERREWDACKARLGQKRDKAALLALCRGG